MYAFIMSYTLIKTLSGGTSGADLLVHSMKIFLRVFFLENQIGLFIATIINNNNNIQEKNKQ